MNKINIILLNILCLLSSVGLSYGQEDDSNWKLVWSDEFNNDTVNTNSWTIQNSYWNKNPKCLYRPEQVTLKNGNLVISAIKNGEYYHSGQLKSNNKIEIGYGKIEIRMKMPKGAGLKTAFWMLGINKDTVGWPRCGEIDIVEQRGFEPMVSHHNIHWYNENEAKLNHSIFELSSEKEITEEFHVYTLERVDRKIKYYMDGHLLREIDISSDNMAEFKNLYYFIIQLDIGNEKTWPGPVDEKMSWPKTLFIDYIRYYNQVID